MNHGILTFVFAAMVLGQAIIELATGKVFGNAKAKEVEGLSADQVKKLTRISGIVGLICGALLIGFGIFELKQAKDLSPAITYPVLITCVLLPIGVFEIVRKKMQSGK